MEEFTLVKDLAVIMITAGAVTFIFRNLRISPLFGYLVAGLLIGPYTFTNAPVANIEEVRLIADLGLILLLFGLGMEFSWARIRQVGFTIILIAAAEITIMVYLGYWLGQLLGWETWDSIFLGGALGVTSSTIAFSFLKELDRLDRLSSKLIIGISVAEDFVAIAIIAVLTGVARTGTATLDWGDAGFIVLKLVIFVAALVGFGTLIVPKMIQLVDRFHSKEAMVITCLGLCFGAALISREIGISGVAGAFLMGSLLGHTDKSKEISETISPIRYMFGALYFVAIGMLIDASHPEDYIIPTIAITLFFIAGKVVGNTLLSFLSGYQPKTAFEVGTGMPQMGEFSLAIAKVGKQYQVVEAPVYPAIAFSSAVTSLISPQLLRLSEPAAAFIASHTPGMLKGYVLRFSEWLQTLRSSVSSESHAAASARRSIRLIIINGLIVMAIVGAGAFLLPLVEDHNWFEGPRADVIGLIVSLIMLVFCIFPFIAMWRAIRNLDNAVVELLADKHKPAKGSRQDTVRIVLRDSILIVLIVFAIIWALPLISELLALGSLALVVPALLLALGLAFILKSVRQIHGRFERSFSQTLLGEEDASDAYQGTGTIADEKACKRLFRKSKPGKPDREKKLEEP